MKKLTALFIVLFLVACTEKDDGVKIVEDYESNYLPKTEVISQVETENEFEDVVEDLRKISTDLSSQYSQPVIISFNYRIYINEKGEVDAIKELSSPKKPNGKDEKVKTLYGKDITLKFADASDNWKFTPATKNNEPVKFRTDLIYSIIINENGEIVEEVSSFKEQPKANRNNDVYYVAVEQQPSPIGGLAAIQEKITYPAKAKREGVEGRVFVKAYINEEGIVDSTEILKGIGSGCDSVAMKAIMDTKFTPGKQRGEPVKVQVSIPIIFKLQ